MSLLKRKSTSQQSSRPERRRSDNSSNTAKESKDRPSNKYAFRRNRNLTGSTSHNINSSNELNAQLVSPRAHVHKLAKTRRKIMAMLIIIAVLSAGVYGLLTQLVADVKISVLGETELVAKQARAYANTVNEYYSVRPAERFRMLLDQQKFLSHMQASHPEIKQANVYPGDGFGKASLSITPRRPIARWSILGGREYVDETGTVFTVNYYPNPELRIVDNSGIQADSKTVLASSRFLGFVGQVAGLTSSYGYPIRQAIIPTQTTRQVEVRLKGESVRYILSIDRSAQEQAEDITRITKFMKQTNRTADYVDIRVKGKAFYK